MKTKRFWKRLVIIVLVVLIWLCTFEFGKKEFGKDFTLIIQNETDADIILRGEKENDYGRFTGNYEFVVEKEEEIYLNLKGFDGRTKKYSFSQLMYPENPIKLDGINLYVTFVDGKVIVADVAFVNKNNVNITVETEIINDTTVKLSIR